METETCTRRITADEIIAMPLANWRRYIKRQPRYELLRLRDRLHYIAFLAHLCGPQRPLGKAKRRWQAIEAALEAPG